MPQSPPFDDREVVQIIYEILFQLYVEDKDGAALEAAARGVGIESLAATKITEALREVLVPPSQAK